MQKVIEGILTNYEIVGRGKRNLVILHGWGGSLDEWKGVAGRLVGRYRIVMLDFPGLGGSSKPREDWGVYEYADFTEKFLRSSGIKKAVVMGHSFGGRIAILLAANTNLVEKLVLVDAAGVEIKSFKARALRWFSPIGRRLPQFVKNMMASQDYRSAGVMKNIFVKVVNQHLRAELAKIKAPTLIVWGEKDGVLPFAEAKFLHKGIKNSILRIVWGSNHWPHTEKTDEFVNILEEEGI